MYAKVTVGFIFKKFNNTVQLCLMFFFYFSLSIYFILIFICLTNLCSVFVAVSSLEIAGLREFK